MSEKLTAGGMVGLRFADRPKKAMIKLRIGGLRPYVRVASFNNKQGYLPLQHKIR